MAYILIDGYNLIGIAHKDLEKERNNLIKTLCDYSEIKGHDITLVFDGWKSGQTVETRTKIKGVHIIFSRLGEKADNVIKKILSHAAKPWIVVSSDREISDFARRKNCIPLTSEEFERKLFSSFSVSYKEAAGESAIDEYEDTDKIPVRQKGNPRKTSKKLKRKLRALKKL